MSSEKAEYSSVRCMLAVAANKVFDNPFIPFNVVTQTLIAILILFRILRSRNACIRIGTLVSRRIANETAGHDAFYG